MPNITDLNKDVIRIKIKNRIRNKTTLLILFQKINSKFIKNILGKAFILVHGAHLIEFFSSRIFSPPPPLPFFLAIF